MTHQDSMDIGAFDYQLPKELIAQEPQSNRASSKLLIPNFNNGQHHIAQFDHLIDYVNQGDLLIFNDTKVVPARLHGYKDTGGKVELFLERILNETDALVQIKSSKPLKHDQPIWINTDDNVNQLKFRFIEKQKTFSLVQLSSSHNFGAITSIMDVFNRYGQTPLPPYIDRAASLEDEARYQTIYAKNEGAVAAPTAGLHFDHKLLSKLEKKGVNSAYITLHVGAGTYQPVRVNDIRQHKMHQERFIIPSETIDKIRQTRHQLGRIIAVGTTSARALETMMKDLNDKNKTDDDFFTQRPCSYEGESDIFIYPGFEFKLIDGLITNFHLPRSTLMMMVSALSGHDEIMDLYRFAVNHQLRFFSYGDAMLLWRK